MTTENTPKYAVGQIISGRCASNYTEHTGPVVSATPDGMYSNGKVWRHRYTIHCSRLGREVILWSGTEAVAK